MYHFKPTEHAPETRVLNEHTELSGPAIKFLKDFQIGAVRFLFKQFCNRDFSILNDESGLGKSASVAVFLGIVAVKKNCLIVVPNHKDVVTGWKFHLDIMTDLKVSVLNEEKDYVATDFSVYIVKWTVLRSIGDVSKLNFDFIVVDNREQILSNTFCTSTLLKSFEKKVQLVVSSADVTSDVKLMHNILKLGGRLEYQYESFKSFEQKFKLPDLKEISKKADLEDYFLRREILNDYCRDFRLRRYRYQFENILPLVDPERYKIFLLEWQASSNEKETNAATLIGNPLPCEINTEELLAQYQTNPENIAVETAPKPAPAIASTSNAVDKSEKEMQNTMPIALDITDDLMDMPPLVLLTDSDDGANAEEEEQDVIFVSSESNDAAATAIPVIEIEEDEYEKRTPEKAATPKLKVEKLTPQKKSESVGIKENATQEKSIQTRQRNKRKITRPQQLKVTGKAANVTTSERHSNTPRTRRSQLNNESSLKSIGRIIGKKAELNVKKTTSSCPKRKEQTKLKETTSPTKKQTLKLKAEKLTPKKNEPTVDKLNKAQDLALKNEQVSGSKAPTQKQTETRRYRRPATPTTSLPIRATRSMQRSTRSSGGKRKTYALDFDDDSKKPKTKTKQNVSPHKNIKDAKKSELPSKADTAKKSDGPKDKEKLQDKTKGRNIKEKLSNSKKENLKTTQKSSPTAAVKAKPPSSEYESTKEQNDVPRSTQSSVLPMSSDYEEIQCGQNLCFSIDNSPPLLEKPNEFLMPPTPPLFRTMQYSLQPLGDSEVMVVPPTANSQKQKNIDNAIVVLSSSQDEATLSEASSADQRRQTASLATRTQRRKRYSKRTSLPNVAGNEPHSFGDLLAKQRNATKSPDLFSVSSDAAGGSSNVLPFNQPNVQATTTPATVTTTSPVFGFKIFGSEVRSLQQPTASVAKAKKEQPPTARPTRNRRSCLNILEQMFENNDKTTSIETSTSSLGNAKAKNQRKLRNGSRLNTQALNEATAHKVPLGDTQASLQLSPPTPRNPIHVAQHPQKARSETEDIFEITNNAIFGSTLRINAGGHISPVAAAVNNTHKKITHYLIGNGNGNGNSNVTEQLLATPGKKLQPTLPGSGGSSNGVVTTTQARKSPKASKSTQATKLTKWFRRSSTDDRGPNKNAQKTDNNNVSDKSTKAAKLVKRRRLDLSFKS